MLVKKVLSTHLSQPRLSLLAKLSTCVPEYDFGVPSTLPVVLEKPKKYLEVEKKFAYSPAIFELCSKLALGEKKKRMMDVYYDTSSYDLTTKDYWLRRRNQEFELKQPKIELSKQKSSQIDQYYEITDDKSIMKTIDHVLRQPRPKAWSRLHHQSLDYHLPMIQVKPFGAMLTQRTSFKLLLPVSNGFKTWQISLTADFDHVCYSELKQHSSHEMQSLEEDFIYRNKPLTPFCSKYGVSPQHQYLIGELELTCSVQDMRLSVEEIFNQIMKQLNIQSSFSTSPSMPNSSIRGKVLEYLFRFKPDHYESLRKSGQLQSKGILN